MSLKSSIRKESLSRRDSISEDIRNAKDQAIQNSLLSFPAVQACRTILLYASFKSEVDTLRIIRPFLELGKTVALPKVDMEKGELFIYEVKSFDDLAAGCWGIPEPQPVPERMRQAGEMDVIVVPGVAFDEECNRLGYGKGFYDKLLRTKKGPAIALAYEEQIVVSVPSEPHDVKLDFIITDKRIIACRG